MSLQLESTCLEGTVLKGLNIYEGKQDPVAMADEKYPDWLWSILVEPTTKFAEDEKFSKKFIRFQNKEKLKSNSLKFKKLS